MDLARMLSEWPYEAGRINARRIEGADGVSRIQVRIELGVLQMEPEGRPDGLRPDGFESIAHQCLARLEEYERAHGTRQGFVLSEADCAALREEAVQYYHRYVALFVLEDQEGVIRDTSRNLAVFDLCRDHAGTEHDRVVLEQFRPHVITMRARARAAFALREQDPKTAVGALEQGLDELRAAFEAIGRGEEWAESNEVQLLQGMRDLLVPKLPTSQRHELEQRLEAALESENYELAAILRDELRML